jgi:hypothetical protein
VRKFLLWFFFILALALLGLGLLNLDQAKPFAMILWGVVAVGCGYGLFIKKPGK